jgi:hypothetical protein
MLTTILTVVTVLLTLLLFVFQSAFSQSARRKTVYVCDICNTRDCVCREKN